jgi:P27 family predicted phage terminase small subunit
MVKHYTPGRNKTYFNSKPCNSAGVKTKEIFLKFIKKREVVDITKRSEIKKDMLDQLERNGVYGSQYTNLVEDYMSMWDIKNALQKDIKKRGIDIEWDNGGGQKGIKKNDSLTQLYKINSEMLSIRKELGLQPTKNKAVADNEDELEM